MTLAEATLYSWTLIAPMVVLVALAFWVPHRLAQELPQSMGALGVNLAMSSVVLWAVSLVVLAVQYVWQGVPVLEIGRGMGHLAGVGLQSALIWLPIILLQLAMQPQTWRPDL